jgi:poly-gamma-glutamate synthesis protein (capsule biosynthesis protein)
MAVGDVLIHDSLRLSAALPDGSFDFGPSFEAVAPILKQGHLVVANLEVPLAGAERRFGGYPNFNAPVELAANLKSAGFTAVTVANNHALDRGWAGLEATLGNVAAAGLDYAGAYLSPEDKARRLVLVHNGVRVAMLAYTYGLNGRSFPPKGEEWRLGVIGDELIFSDLAAARAQGADFVVVSLHFGEEYWRKPSPYQKEVVRKLLAGGPEPGQEAPDVILGHHPHVVQPFVLIPPQGDQPARAVIWSLGNFISSQPFPWTDIGLILDLRLTLEPDGRRIVGPVRLIPTYCHKGLKGQARLFQVLPLDLAAARPEDYGVPASRAAWLDRSFQDLAKHLLSLEPPAAASPGAPAPEAASPAPAMGPAPSPAPAPEAAAGR